MKRVSKVMKILWIFFGVLFVLIAINSRNSGVDSKDSAKLDSICPWTVGNFVDQFGDTTGKTYITRSTNGYKPVSGIYTGTILNEVPVIIEFIIDDLVGLEFYIRGNSLYKSIIERKYIIKARVYPTVEETDYSDYIFYGSMNSSGRLILGSKNSTKLKSIMKESLMINFVVQDSENSNDYFQFLLLYSDYTCALNNN